MMSKRERCGVAAIGLLLALATGCGGGGSSGGGPEEETQTECGDILCESDEFCLTHEASPLGEANESVLSCEKIPSGCEGLSFCDCEATESLWQGDPISGCTNLGEKHLTTNAGICGSEKCGEGEGCIAFGTKFSNSTRAGENFCHALPEGCQVSSDFCESDCAARLAEAAGQTYQGCMATSWGVAALVQ